MKHNLAARHDRPVAAIAAVCTVERRIRAFINGCSDGRDVLGALYGNVSDEPVPERLLALLKA